MKKNLQFIIACFLLCISVCKVSISWAQTEHYIIGIPGTNHVGDIVKVLPDGSSIIAGYSYTGSTITNADMMLMRVLNGHVLWEKKWGNPGGNDLIQDMIVTTVGDPNGDIVVVSTERSSPTAQAVAGIYRFKSSTGIMACQTHFNEIPYGYDVVLKSVCELSPGGNIVVAGYQRFGFSSMPYTSSLVATFYPDLHFIEHDAISTNTVLGGTRSHMFTGVIADPSHPLRVIGGVTYQPQVLLCGSDFDGSVCQASLMSYTPPVPGPPSLTYPVFPPAAVPGVINWYNLYNIADGVSKPHSMFNQIFYFTDPGGDRLFLNGQVSGDYAFSTNSEQFTFSSSNTGTSPINVHSLTNSSAFANTIRIHPYSYVPGTGDFKLYVTQNPNATLNDPVLGSYTAVVNGVISNITSLNTPTIAFSRSSTSSIGTHISILDARQAASGSTGYTTGVLDNFNGTADKYIYTSVFSPVYNKTTFIGEGGDTSSCGYHDSTLSIHSLATPSISTVNYYIGKMWASYPPDLVDTFKYPNVDSCGVNNPSNPCAEAGTATLTVNWTGDHGSDCNFNAQMIVSPGIGWHVSGYTMFGPCFPGMSFPSPGNVFNRTFTVANGTCCTITLTVTLVDGSGHICTITKSEYVCCKNGVGTTTTTACGTATISPNGVSYLNGNCGYWFTAFVTPDPGWTVVSYQWAGPGLFGVTHYTSSNTDAQPSFILSPGTSGTVTVTITLTDGAGHYCTIVEHGTVSCPGCGTILINPTTTATTWGCVIGTTVVVNPQPGWTVADYTWTGPAGQVVDQTSSNQDAYPNFTLQPGTNASVSVTAHLIDGNGDDCYLTDVAPSVGCAANCGNTVQLTPAITPDPSGCSVSAYAVVSPDPNYTIVDYNWDGPAGTYTDVMSNSQDVYQSFILQPNTSALVSVSVDLTDIYGYGDICTVTQSAIATCPSNKQNNNAGLNNLQSPRSGIIIYPNPTDGEINISSSESNIRNVEVYDIAGKRLEAFSFDNTNMAHVSIAGYAAGTYVIKVNSNVKQIVNKIK